MLFKIVEYGVIAIGINALLPKTPVNWNIILLGGVVLLIIFIFALLVTPEKQKQTENE